MDNFRIAVHFDSPPVLNCVVTPIPGSGSLPLQVVASTPHPITKILCTNKTGKYVGIYYGAPGEEVFIGTLEQDIQVALPVNTRFSLRSMDVSEITTGTCFCTFQFR